MKSRTILSAIFLLASSAVFAAAPKGKLGSPVRGPEACPSVHPGSLAWEPLLGRVTDSAGNPVPGMSIYVADDAKNFLWEYIDIRTDADGRYELPLPSGHYYVNACDCFDFGRYVDTWFPSTWDTLFWSDLERAELVEVGDGPATADFRLADAGWIELKLADGDGRPIDAKGSDPGSFGRLFFDFHGTRLSVDSGASATGDLGDGRYVSYPLPVGTTTFVEAWPAGKGFQPVYSGGATTLAEATPVPISTAAAQQVVITMEESGASLSGTFVFPSDAAFVYAEELLLIDVNLWRSFRVTDFSYRPITGGRLPFEIRGLPDGDYRLWATLQYETSNWSFDGVSFLYPGLAYVPFSYPFFNTSNGKVLVVREADLDLGEVGLSDRTYSAAFFASTFHMDLLAALDQEPEGRELVLEKGPGTSSPVSWTVIAPPWLSVSPSSGELGLERRAGIRITPVLEGLPAGDHEGVVEFVPSDSSLLGAQVGVFLRVTEPAEGEPRLRFSTDRILATSGIPSQATPVRCELANDGDGPTAWRLDGWFPREGTLTAGEKVQLTSIVGWNGMTTLDCSNHSSTKLLASRAPSMAGPAVDFVVAPDPEAGARALPDSSTRERIVPVVAANAPGAAGSLWSSDLHVALSPACAEPDLAWEFEGWLTPIGATSGNGSLRVSEAFPSDAFSIPQVVESVFDRPGTVGALSLRGKPAWTDASFDFHVWSSCSTPAPDGRGRYGQEVPELGDESIVSAGSPGVVPVLLGPPFRSNLILVETAGAAAEVTIRIRSGEGILVGEPIVRPLAPFEQIAVNDLLAGRSLGRAWAEITVAGAGRIGGIGSVVDSRTNDPTTIPIQKTSPTLSSGRILFPVVTHGAGANGTLWQSDVWIVNVGSSSHELRLRFKEEGTSTGWIEVGSLTIPAGGQAALEDVVGSRVGSESAKGSLELAGDAEAVADLRAISRTFNAAATGTFGQGIWPVTPDRVVVGGDRSASLVLVGLDQDREARSNLGLVEVAGAPVDVRIFVPRNGWVGVLAFSLAPFELRQLNGILAQLWALDSPSNEPGNSLRRMEIEISVEGAGSLSAYGSRVDNVTGDGTTIPAFR